MSEELKRVRAYAESWRDKWQGLLDMSRQFDESFINRPKYLGKISAYNAVINFIDKIEADHER